ncbi:hypothetical protein QQS21_011690 [Conoideocrella luteorostrata]|uniref:Lytic polysaccharide monooxygenase n=1 Tax=Conoideocrella luteorostrata TaxID=1105319 RepID=A0AAJ0FT45_9HYPO|nr:hypothetical protein QQS21_011690 [Conoideocrella luteorostrata]
MKTLKSAVFTVLSLTSFTGAHMQMSDPPPLLSKFNKYTTNQDYDMTSPLHADGSNYPCKGHHEVLGTSQGQPVAQWTPGQSYSMTITGQAAHNGGSCQSSLSFDKGKSWRVIHSYIGNCPVVGDSTYDFTLPGDTPAGEMLFAWTWFNQVGNREMYMNCAAIMVQDGARKKRRGVARSMKNRPKMFVANVGNDCGTVEGKDVMFPDPGADVDMNSKDTSPPTGNCAASSRYSTLPTDSLDDFSSSGSPASLPKAAAGSSGPSADVPSPPPYIDMSLPLPSAPKMPSRGTNTSTTWHGMLSPPTMPPMADMPTGPLVLPTAPPPISNSCQPGSYQCTTAPSGGQGWQVCDVSGSWVYAGDCGPGQVCKFNAANGSPYCVPPDFQFP